MGKERNQFVLEQEDVLDEFILAKVPALVEDLDRGRRHWGERRQACGDGSRAGAIGVDGMIRTRGRGEDISWRKRWGWGRVSEVR
jgi:hypothetical protein